MDNANDVLVTVLVVLGILCALAFLLSHRR